MMINPFYTLYNYFKNKRIYFFLILIIIFAGSFYFINKLRLEEDITKMLPADESLARITQASSELKFMDKIAVSVSLIDTSISNPDLLIQYTDSLVFSIENELIPEFISEITYKVSQGFISELYAFYFNHLPILLDTSDFKIIQEKISQEAIETAIQSNFKTLISPASVVMRQFVVKDPLHFTPIALNKLNDLKIDNNYSIYRDRIFSKDKKYLLLFLDNQNPSVETALNAKLFDKLDQRIAELKEYEPGLNIIYYGASVVSSGNANRIKKDITLTLSIAIGLLIVFLSLFFRKPGIFPILFLPAIFGGAMAIAFIYLIQSSVSAISLAMGSVLLGITVDYALHLFTHHKTVQSVKKTLGDVTIPVLMSCLTTVSAFLCLLFVSSDALHDMGIFAAISVFTAAIFSLIVLPHFLKKSPAPSKKERLIINSFIHRISSYNFHQNKYLLLIIGIFSVVAIFTAPLTKFDGDMDNMSFLSPELKEAENVMNSISDMTLKSAYIITEGENFEDALQKNSKVKDKIELLRSNNTITSFVCVNDFVNSEKEQKKKIEVWQQFWDEHKLEELKNNLINAGAKYKFKDESFDEFINILSNSGEIVNPNELFNLHKDMLGDYVTIAKDKVTIVNLVKLDESNKPILYNAFIDQSESIVFDKNSMTDRLVLALKNDFGRLVNYSLIVVFLILLFAYGRIEIAVLTFIPMAVSWLWTLGVMGIIGIKFTIFNIIVSTFIFGLGIDYSIFIMRGLLQEYRYGDKNLNSYKTSILLSAITTIAGIGALIFAKHPALKSMALLSIIGITSVIFVSFALEPFLFNAMIMIRKKKRKVAYTFRDAIMSLFAYSVFSIGAFTTTFYGLIIFSLFRLKSKKLKLIFHYMIMISCRMLGHSSNYVKWKILNPNDEDLKKPAVIIANHQSHIDLIIMMMLQPKILILTNDRVQSNFIYGRLLKMADFYPMSLGMDELTKKLEPKVKEGYSIGVFPEGTRSTDFKVKRFHKGAFLLAEKLKIDILPVVLHGMGLAMTKGDDLLLKRSRVTINYLPRISPENTEFGSTYSERAKLVGRHIRSFYNNHSFEKETTRYNKDKLIKNYIFRGPVLEWYMRVKLKMEKNYEIFHQLTPRKGKIYDIGCGYGYMSHMLQFTSDQREIIGIDFDEEKIRTAQNINSNIDKVKFIFANAVYFDYDHADAFILSDVVHYLSPENQQKLVKACIEKTNPGGIIMIRDANKNLNQKHKGTEYTELFSTKVLGFNKTENDQNRLFFFSRDDVENMISTYPDLTLEVIDNTKLTSNVLYVIRKM